MPSATAAATTSSVVATRSARRSTSAALTSTPRNVSSSHARSPPVTGAPAHRSHAPCSASARAAGSACGVTGSAVRALNTLVSGSRATNAAAPAARISRCRVSCTKARSCRSEASKSACFAVHDSTCASNCDGVIAYVPSGYGAGAGTASGAGSNAALPHTPPPHMVRFSPRNGFLRQMKDRDPSARAPREPTRTSVARPPGSFESRRRDRDREPTARGKHPPPRCVRRVPRELRSASVPLAFSSESAK